MIDYPNKLNIIFDKLLKNGVSPIIIGGYIRDNLLKIQSKDIDIEVYNIKSFEKLENLLQEFGSVNSVGKSFGVCKLNYNGLEIDFTLPRVESKIAKGHRGFKVEVKTNISFYQATSRRDFTINSIAYEIKEKKILDPFNGVNDLKNKILRPVSKDTFKDDPLRVLRAVQFCARFELTPDKTLSSMIVDMMDKNLLDEISKERIFLEFKKLLLKAKKPSIGFELLVKLQIIESFLELKYIYENKLYEELLFSLDEMAKLKTTNDKTNIILMFSVIGFYIDDEKDVEIFLNRFTNDKNFIKGVVDLLKYKDINIYKLNSYTLSKLATTIKLNILFIFLNVLYAKEDKKLTLIKDAKNLAKQLHILDKKIPALLSGKDLINCGFLPSKKFKITLDKAYDAQLNGEFTTHKEALVWIQKKTIL